MVPIFPQELLGSLEVAVDLLTICDQFQGVCSDCDIVEPFLGFSQSFHGILEVVPDRLDLAVDGVFVLYFDLAVVFSITVLENVKIMMSLSTAKITH